MAEIKFNLIVDTAAGTAALNNMSTNGATAFRKLETVGKSAGDYIKNTWTSGFGKMRQEGDNAFRKLEDAGARAGQRIASVWHSLKASWVELLAVGYSLNKAWDLAESTVKLDQQRVAFNNLARSMGADADSILASLRRMSAGTIDAAGLMASAGQAMLLGIPVDKLNSMMAAARASARITGKTIREAFDDITLGAARQSKLILDNLGIMVNVDKAYRDYAATLKRSANSLTDAEKKQAFLNEVMRQSNEIVERVKVTNLTAAEAMQVMKVKATEAWNFIGRVIAVTAGGIIGVLAGISEGFWQLTGDLTALISYLVRLGQEVPLVGKYFKGASETLDTWALSARATAANAGVLKEQAFALVKALIAGEKATTDVARGTGDQDTVAKEANKTWQTMEARILEVVIATEKLTASKSRLIELEALELSLGGATLDQLTRYKQAREAQQKIDEDIAAKREAEENRKRAAEAAKNLQRLEQTSPYKLNPAEGIVGMQERNKLELEELRKHHTDILTQKALMGASEVELEQTNASLITAYKRREDQLQLQSKAQMVGASANFLENLYVATGRKHKALFAAMKAFSIAEAIINTAQGATKALAQGGFLGIAMAASVIAAGAAQIATISSTNPGSSGAISASGTAAPTYSGGSTSAYPTPQRIEQQAPITVNVSIHNPIGTEDWDYLAEEKFGPAIKRAVSRNALSF